MFTMDKNKIISMSIFPIYPIEYLTTILKNVND